MALPARKETRFWGMRHPQDGFLLTFVCEQLAELEKRDRRCAALLLSALDAMMIENADRPVRDLMDLAVSSMPGSAEELREWIQKRDAAKCLAGW